MQVPKQLLQTHRSIQFPGKCFEAELFRFESRYKVLTQITEVLTVVNLYSKKSQLAKNQNRSICLDIFHTLAGQWNCSTAIPRKHTVRALIQQFSTYNSSRTCSALDWHSDREDCLQQRKRLAESDVTAHLPRAPPARWLCLLAAGLKAHPREAALPAARVWSQSNSPASASSPRLLLGKNLLCGCQLCK